MQNIIYGQTGLVLRQNGCRHYCSCREAEEGDSLFPNPWHFAKSHEDSADEHRILRFGIFIPAHMVSLQEKNPISCFSAPSIHWGDDENDLIEVLFPQIIGET